MSPKVEDLDLYNETCKYPLVYDSTVDPVVVREVELMATEAKSETGKKVSGDSDVGSDVETGSEGSTSEDSSDSEYEVDEGDDEWENVSDVPKAVKGAKKKKVKAPKVFTPVDKIHCVAVHILHSEIRRKTALQLIRRKHEGSLEHDPRGARASTVVATGIRRVRERDAERPYWKGKEGRAGPKEKWEMSSGDWEFVDKLVKALEVLKLCTLEFSKKSVPTITKVLPLYNLMEVTLTTLATKHKEDEPTLSTALLAGAAVTTKYISNALFGDYVLLGAGTISFIIG
ncbi:hypothetical protein K438DRAFT_1749592 [Mycena galopus ATCC 62051]|nr:hypothetical protein K438DRAFT_1749592 [Mycena galopus ATCC 62051]